MQVKVLKEEGHDIALLGLAYAFKDRAVEVANFAEEKLPKMYKLAPKQAHMDGGHNKFIRQIKLWIDIEACRAWWSEFDTYKIGTVAQSESTMHTLAKRAPTKDDFEEGTSLYTVQTFYKIWEENKTNINVLKLNLPEGYLQRRIVSMDYATLKNIVEQRTGHRFIWWDRFIKSVLEQVEHPEYIIKD